MDFVHLHIDGNLNHKGSKNSHSHVYILSINAAQEYDASPYKHTKVMHNTAYTGVSSLFSLFSWTQKSFLLAFPHSHMHVHRNEQLFNLLHIRHRIHSSLLICIVVVVAVFISHRLRSLFLMLVGCFFLLIVVDALYSSSLEKRVKYVYV